MASVTGLWDRWYAIGLDEPQPFGDTITYAAGVEWLAGCALVEDWGCGKGWLRTLIPPERYRGVDGSRTPFADVVADLAEYRSRVPGVFMRHVLEHNQRWRGILRNAAASATERLFIVLFTPLVEKTRRIAYWEDPGVPDIAFRLEDITSRLARAGWDWTVETVETATQYDTETMLRCRR